MSTEDNKEESHDNVSKGTAPITAADRIKPRAKNVPKTPVAVETNNTTLDTSHVDKGESDSAEPADIDNVSVDSPEDNVAPTSDTNGEAKYVFATGDAPEDEEYEGDNVALPPNRRRLNLSQIASRKSADALKDFTPPDDIKVVDDERSKGNIIEQYLTVGNDLTRSNTLAREVLPYSGIHIDITSYTYSETSAIHGASAKLSFVDQLTLELETAYNHTVSTSLKRKLTFDEFLESISYLDAGSVYHGIYDANHPGVNKYDTHCHVEGCNGIVKGRIDNSDLVFIGDNSSEDITDEDIEAIRNGVDRTLTKGYQISTELFEREGYLTESKFKIFYGIPNMKEVLIFLRFIQGRLNESDEVARRVFQPLSKLASGVSPNVRTTVLMYKYNMYTRRVIAPDYRIIKGKEKGSTEIRPSYVNNDTREVYELIHRLSMNDFREFATGNVIRKLLIKDGIIHKVVGQVCPKCKKEQHDLVLDIREIIFMRAEEMADLLLGI